jgi:hypothetical protein
MLDKAGRPGRQKPQPQRRKEATPALQTKEEQ